MQCAYSVKILRLVRFVRCAPVCAYLKCSVRQGCPFSMLIYALMQNQLLIATDNELTGIRLTPGSAKVNFRIRGKQGTLIHIHVYLYYHYNICDNLCQ